MKMASHIGEPKASAQLKNATSDNYDVYHHRPVSLLATANSKYLHSLTDFREVLLESWIRKTIIISYENHMVAIEEFITSSR